jgi:hypothetical protein
MPRWIDRWGSGCLLVDVLLCFYFLLELGWSAFSSFNVRFLVCGLGFLCVLKAVLCCFAYFNQVCWKMSQVHSEYDYAGKWNY